MNKTSVLAALKRGDVVCHRISRWHVGYDQPKDLLYKFNVLTGHIEYLTDPRTCSGCYIHVGGVGSDD